jgi:hypothetical protein
MGEPYGSRPYPPPRWSYPNGGGVGGGYDGPPPPPPPPHMMQGPSPYHHHHHPPPPLIPPPPSRYDDLSPGGGPHRPYSYAQHPHAGSKTVLRKKFSWKHYPEVRCAHHIHHPASQETG